MISGNVNQLEQRILYLYLTTKQCLKVIESFIQPTPGLLKLVDKLNEVGKVDNL